MLPHALRAASCFAIGPPASSFCKTPSEILAVAPHYPSKLSRHDALLIAKFTCTVLAPYLQVLDRDRSPSRPHQDTTTWGMTTGLESQHTPVEALLLFTYLSSYGVQPSVFNKISEDLKGNKDIRASESYDPGRLSPDALKDFFLRLLKEEAKSEVQQSIGGGDHEGLNGDVQPGSRKRKARSPSLPTIQDAMKHTHLIPQLIMKLHSRWRQEAVAGIRVEERRVYALKQQLEDIESGAWDVKFQKEVETEEQEVVTKKKDKPAEHDVDRVKSSPSIAEDTALQRHSEEPSGQQTGPQNALPALVPPPSISPPPPPPAYPQISHQQPPAISPRPPVTQPNGSQYRVPVPALHQSPYAQHTTAASATSPRPQDTTAQSRPPPSPVMAPPPVPSTSYPSHQIPPYPPYSNNAHPPPRHSNQGQYPPSTQGSPTQMSPTTQYSQPYGPSHSQYSQQPVAPTHGTRGGVMLQPFTVSAQTPTGVRQQLAPVAPNQSASRPLFTTPAAGSKTVNAAPITPGIPLQRPLTYSPFEIAKMLSTPTSANQVSSGEPVLKTPWSASSKLGRGARKSSPVRPRSRSISPISERGSSPALEMSTATRSSRRGKQNISNADLETGSQQGRLKRTQPRRGRGGSTTSSALGGSTRGRTRSQSVISHAEDVSMIDNDSVSGRRVKPEPSTPADAFDHVRPTIESTPSSSGPAGSTRRGTLQFNANKRKRGLRNTSESSDTIVPQPRQDKSMVLATRNFPRLSTSLMNDITSRKHASIFQNPVREKDAEGYTTMIRRPQDLKSLQRAINAGSRAVNAATADSASTAPTSSPRDAGGNVLLPVNEDLIPPKGIVSSAQLEKEVMRMFANAVMFNPGEDDVVQDTREMFEEVEQHIANFRSVERVNTAAVTAGEARRGRSEIETVEEEEPATISKRRRL